MLVHSQPKWRSKVCCDHKWACLQGTGPWLWSRGTGALVVAPPPPPLTRSGTRQAETADAAWMRAPPPRPYAALHAACNDGSHLWLLPDHGRRASPPPPQPRPLTRWAIADDANSQLNLLHCLMPLLIMLTIILVMAKLWYWNWHAQHASPSSRWGSLNLFFYWTGKEAPKIPEAVLSACKIT
jgi:hypothetical protein